MSKINKILLVAMSVLLILAVALALVISVADDPLPQNAQQGEAAEKLADQMLMALGKPAYDSLRLIEWTFRGKHHFVWDKDINRVSVDWDDYQVTFFPESLTGEAYQEGEMVRDTARQKELIQKAWSYFANDSFWLVAPFKIRDPGTVRSLVQTEEGPGLLVTYQSGGVTPGDSYMWILDDQNRPKSWKMWVSIIPVGGLTFDISQWQTRQGAWFAVTHLGPQDKSIDLDLIRVE